MPRATAHLIGPVFYWLRSGRDPRDLDVGAVLVDFLHVAAPTLAAAQHAR